jgi:hypothetical protein
VGRSASTDWILIRKSMHHGTTTLTQYVPDLARDRFHVWITKYHYLPITRSGPSAAGRAACHFCYGEISCAQWSDCTPPG